MPRDIAETGRIELRVSTDVKATLARAAALTRQDLTSYILSASLPRAEEDLKRAEQVALSARDTQRVLALLETPPKPNDRLKKAAKAGFTLK